MNQHNDEAPSTVGNNTEAAPGIVTDVKKAPKATIILAAGGTGGHMFPAQALAHDLISRGYRVVLATDQRGMSYGEKWDGVEAIQLSSGHLNKGFVGKVRSLFALAFGFLKARSVLKKSGARVAVGFGGYPSLPMMVAAQRSTIPTILHEQNAVLGKANAFLAPKADRIAVSLPNTVGLDEADMMRCVLTGNPVRQDVSSLYVKPYPSYEEGDVFRLFVMGGSQGASVFSKVLPEALRFLCDDSLKNLHVTQQCRNEEELKTVRDIYNSLGIQCRLETFIDNVAQELEKAHLVVSRAGASTVAEVTTAGRPAIFIPYPHHKDQQQKVNADTVANAGGAWVMEEGSLTAETLHMKIEHLMKRPDILFRAAEAARGCARPDAARKLGNLVTAIAQGWNKEENKTLDYTQGHNV